MRDVRQVLELLENEQLTVTEAEKFIKAIVERGESPVLPQGTGRLAPCSKGCGEIMGSHDFLNRYPKDPLYGASLSTTFVEGAS